MDRETLGDTVHNVNMLTVIASESYKDFVSDLQSDIKKELYDRPSKATIEYFEGKTVMVGARYYNLNGIRLSQPQNGLNIIRESDGTVKKALVRK